MKIGWRRKKDVSGPIKYTQIGKVWSGPKSLKCPVTEVNLGESSILKKSQPLSVFASRPKPPIIDFANKHLVRTRRGCEYLGVIDHERIAAIS
jgi:hypothetical protein